MALLSRTARGFGASLAGHSSQDKNLAQSHQSTVQRHTALTPAKWGSVRRETATPHRAHATLSHRNSARTLRYSRTRRGKKVPSLPIRRLQGTVVLPTINHQECSLMALQPPLMHGKQSRDTGTHGSEGLNDCQRALMPHGGALSGGHMHACMAPSQKLRPSVQCRHCALAV